MGETGDNNWPMVKLGKILTERREKPDLEAILTGEIPIVAKIGFGTGEIELREESKTKTNMILIKPGDLVISGINAEKGAIAIYGEENKKLAAATIHYSSYEINKGKADSLYLWYFLRSRTFRSILLSKLPKGIKTEVKPRRLLPIEIPFPDLEEQKRIVARIESLLAKIEEARRLRAEAVIEVEKAIKSILRKIFLNDGWITNKLGDVCDTTSGGTPSRERPDFFNGEIPWLKSGELNDTLIVDSEERITEEGLQNSNAKIFTRGTLLIALYGATTGKTGILGVDAATNQAICAIFPNKNIIEGDYLHWFLRFKRDDYLLKSFGGAQPNISQKLLKETKIPIPPLPEQRRIVAYLDSLQAKMDELKRLQAETEKQIEKLVPSILDRAFKGEL